MLFWVCMVTLAPGREAVAQMTGFGCGVPGDDVDAGPWDFRNPASADKRRLVERFHFTPKVEQLIAGQSASRIGADLDYTLRHLPNHARALSAMMNLARREKTDRPAGSRYPLGCWFERAVRFAPDDAAVHLMYGHWLATKGERASALGQLEQAEEGAKGSAGLSYNLGLVYCDLQEFDKALVAAHRAYAMGYNLPGLRNRLVRAGKWREPEPPAKETAADVVAAPAE